MIPLKYDRYFTLSDGMGEVGLKGKVGMVDKTGREIIPVKYDDIWSTVFQEEGFIGVTLNGKKGFVDFYGNEYFNF